MKNPEFLLSVVQGAHTSAQYADIDSKPLTHPSTWVKASDLDDWVDENGNPSHVKVVRGVGMGLDEKAIEAVRQYKFKPAMQNGKPVKVDLYVDVNFQIF